MVAAPLVTAFELPRQFVGHPVYGRPKIVGDRLCVDINISVNRCKSLYAFLSVLIRQRDLQPRHSLVVTVQPAQTALYVFAQRIVQLKVPSGHGNVHLTSKT
jgi:hypothetical protein